MEETHLTDAELVILSLIAEAPRHGYAIEQEINRRNMRAWTDLATSSIYYVLKRLEEAGHIEPAGLEAGGRGAPRKIYRLTPAGETTWKTATLHALARPRITYTNFLMGLHNLGSVPPGEAAQALRRYRGWLKKDLARQREELDRFGVSFFPLDVLFEYGFVLGEAELHFLSRLIARLERMDDKS